MLVPDAAHRAKPPGSAHSKLRSIAKGICLINEGLSSKGRPARSVSRHRPGWPSPGNMQYLVVAIKVPNAQRFTS